MKITIDTEKLVIGVEAPVNLGELYVKITTLFPNDEWKGYSIEAVIEIRIIEKEILQPVYPYPWITPSWPTSPTVAPQYPPDYPIIYGTLDDTKYTISY